MCIYIYIWIRVVTTNRHLFPPFCTTGVDGCPNAAMRLKDSAEHKMEANAGLPQIALSLLGPIAAKYVPRLISHADLSPG